MRDMLRRIWLAGAVAGMAASAIAIAPGSAAAAEPSFGVAKFLAGTCTVEGCNEESALSELFTQAAGHPDFGVTDFTLNTTAIPVTPVALEPIGNVKNVRVDLPRGLSVNPEAVPECSMAEFGEAELPGVPPGTGFYPPTKCGSASEVGTETLTVLVDTGLAPPAPPVANIQLTGKVYDLVPPNGLPLEFGVAVDVTTLAEGVLKTALPPHSVFAHSFIEGALSWHPETGLGGTPIEPSGDYHELFNIKNIPTIPPLVGSRLVFNGRAGKGLLTMPSSCEGPLTTYLEVQSYKGEVAKSHFTTPVGASGCSSVPFKPEVNVVPSTTQSDQPDGARVEVKVPQNADPTQIDSSTVQQATVNLPEGMTLNPAAADGLRSCTDAQFGKGTGNPVACPAGSKIGTVTIETPTLPAKALTGNVYVGAPIPGATPASGREYRIFMNAESPRYGVTIRLEGRVSANEQTGQLTTFVPENPPLPFSDFIVDLEGGAHTPLANPLSCGPARTTASLLPFSGTGAVDPFTSFTVDLNGKGAACPSPLPFNVAQATSALPTTGGGATSFTLSLAREDGQQYLSTVSTTLPEGLLAKIPAVPLCGEPAAQQGSCPAASLIGTAAVKIGSGASPYPLSGNVYLTGPYDGAPYGLTVVVDATKVGPFDYGLIITRARIEVNPYTARVTVAASLPTIVGGAPIRLRSLTISITHAGFMVNPTSCAVLSTDSTLTSTFGATTTVSTPFQATGCSALPFKPSFAAYSNAKTSRKRGAAREVSVKQAAGEANIASVSVTLPKILPSRESTLKGACPAAIFEANPYACPASSRVGGASVTTPTLPGALKGPAYFVSHGGVAFPDLDLVLSGDGVTVILVGHTNIKGGITHSNFTSLPDAPISSLHMKLPVGAHSALAAPDGLCRHKVYMPTVIVGQNGVKVTQKTQIKVARCPIEIIHHKVARRHAKITVMVPSAGKLILHGKYLHRVAKTPGNARQLTIEATLTRQGQRLLSRHHRLKVQVHLQFTPAKSHAKNNRSSKRTLKLTFRG